MLSCQPHPCWRTKREPCDMRLLDSRSLHEGGHIVSESLGGIVGFRFVGFTGSPQVEREAGEVLGILGHLEGVTGVIGGKIRNENKRFSGSLLVIIYCDVVGFDLRHERSSSFLPPGASRLPEKFKKCRGQSRALSSHDNTFYSRLTIMVAMEFLSRVKEYLRKKGGIAAAQPLEGRREILL